MPVWSRRPRAGRSHRHLPIEHFKLIRHGDAESVKVGQFAPVEFQNSATVVDLGFLRGPLIFVEEACAVPELAYWR
jgi:hypothetical protein